MFVDASVVVAIINREDGFQEYLGRMSAHKGKFFCSPLARFEATAAIAKSRAGEHKSATPDMFKEVETIVDGFFKALDAQDITITPSIGKKALDVAATYGKFVGHKAKLNFGDCYSYACAKAYSVELLYKGDDFARTDLA